MANINYDNIEWFEENNVSQRHMVRYSGNIDHNVHVIGASRLGEQTVFRDSYPGAMSQAVASIETERGDFAFEVPQRIVIPKLGEENITTLVIRFGMNTGQFATRMRIDGVEYTNNSPEFRLSRLQDVNPHVVEITHWNVLNFPVRITHIGTSDLPQLDYIRVGDSPNSLRQLNKMFSSWTTKNRLIDVASPQTTLDMTIHRSNEMGYRPEITFQFNHLTPEQWRDASRAFNVPFFFIEYYDQELLMFVIRKMYLAEHNSDRPLAFDWTYKGMIGNKFRAVSYLGFDVRDADGNILDQPHSNLIKYASCDPRWGFCDDACNCNLTEEGGENGN